MTLLIPFWIAPLLFILLTAYLSLRRSIAWRRAGLYGLVAFSLFLLLGTYSILQSRSSTAGIGFIFLPIIALVPGLIGVALGKAHRTFLQARQAQPPSGSRRNMIMLGVVLLLPFVWQVYATLDTMSRNNARDAESAHQTAAIKENTQELARLLSASPGKESDILSQTAAQTTDRTMLISIAASPFASADLLETLSRSTDFGVVLSVVRNKNTASKTLEWVYKNHHYPPYFYMDLSGNPNTPAAILHELYGKRGENNGITMSLASNPRLPNDILTKLSLEQDKYVLRNILDRPQLTCAQVSNVVSSVNAMHANDVAWLMDKARGRTVGCTKGDG